MDVEFLKLIEQGAARRPVAYNRRWHLDEDDRRHHGRRKWEPAAIDRFVDLLAGIEGLYPPDWSAADAVRFRGRIRGHERLLADLFTDSPDALRVVLTAPARPAEITLVHAAQLEENPFTRLFERAVAEFLK